MSVQHPPQTRVARPAGFRLEMGHVTGTTRPGGPANAGWDADVCSATACLYSVLCVHGAANLVGRFRLIFKGYGVKMFIDSLDNCGLRTFKLEYCRSVF